MTDRAERPSGGHTPKWGRGWRYARGLAAPILLWVLVALALLAPLRTWLRGEDTYDQAVLREWLQEARVRETLPEMIDDYVARVHRRNDLLRHPPPANDARKAQELTTARVNALHDVVRRRSDVWEHLKNLGNPPTKIHPGQLPLFPFIYRLEVRLRFNEPLAAPPPAGPGALTDLPTGAEFNPEAPVVWDSDIPSGPSQYEELEQELPLSDEGARFCRATVSVRYQLHAFNKRWRLEQEHARRLRQLSVLAVVGTALGLTWLVLGQRREREREHQRLLARQQADQAERLLLREERRHAETERKLLEQRLATQAAERQALELKSQLYANIGIMAGSYAHNIKNLLVRPNDLLRRCLEADGLSADQQTMLHEVQQTLGTVTERLQQILHTVRRDPGHSEEARLDLNALLRDLARTWTDLAREKWKLELALDLEPGPLWLRGDASHLQQAVENLLFNARDATFEMRNHLRDEARRTEGPDPARRQALIAAAGWRGRVVLRTRRAGGEVVLEVCDNGAGMAEEVRRRCTETHFSTKRDNAIYEGHSTGMGLGLSFVLTILEHHRARLEIESEPLQGAVFRVRFPAAA